MAGATGVGVGAIVGGGILALAGVAFATTGPGAMLAFGLNGAIAMLTALSFAEMASKFPESGGTYTFARKVLSVEAAFAVGWVVWFASIVAAVLYAMGFAYFAVIMVTDIWSATGHPAPAWLSSSHVVPGLAVITTVLLAASLMLRSAGGGAWANIGKVAVFAVLIVGGLWALTKQTGGETGAALRPFLANGFAGVIQAMGYTFIALQGFDLIAAVGGEVREPARNLPRAMLASLGIALAIYLPLLFVITTVGVPSGQSVAELAAEYPEGIVALAARHYLGSFGYWLVIVAAVLSMFSALQANLFAASRIARTMARDRTLPRPMAALHAKRGTPVMAVLITSAVVIVLLLVLPSVAAAGAASSLIFLITFAVAHWLAILVRQRSVSNPPPFRAPLFPVVPIVGGLACLGLAVFQGVVVPAAGAIAMTWLAVGGAMFLALFARRARVRDAASTARNPELVTLRGNTPLVLVPIANPHNAEAIVTLAHTLVPAEVGRVVALTVAVAPDDWDPSVDAQPIERAAEVQGELLKATRKIGIQAEVLTTVAADPIAEITRVAHLHRCRSVLLGLGEIAGDNRGSPVEQLLSMLDVDIVVLRAPRDWNLTAAKRVLVPVAGRGGHDLLLARLLGSLIRTGQHHITFFRVLPTLAGDVDVRRARDGLTHLADDDLRDLYDFEVIRSDDAIGAVVERAKDADLLVLGVQRVNKRTRLFGNFTRQIAMHSACPLIVISHGR
ncbi:MAG: amino acid permease [Phycisphaera sp.]|nr:amino acid permease [Phycisphaera sp.]